MPTNELFDLTGKVALVTGGNSGLGFGFATGLAKCGADVWIWGRRQEENDEAVKRLSAHGTKIRAQQVDVSSESEVIAAVAEIVAEAGRLDTVVSNAGVVGLTSFDSMSTQEWEQLLAINLHGGFFTVREGFRHMKARAEKGDAGGSIIICGSLSVSTGVPWMAHYAAAKGALAAMMKTVAVEGGQYGIRCNMVSPGTIFTGLMQGIPEDDIPLTAILKERNPIPRWGYPDDVEGIAAYLAGPSARYHTGDIIMVDGGQSAVLIV